MKRRLLATLISGLLLGAGLAHAQNTYTEQEPNDSAAGAKLVDISSGSAVISGSIATIDDVDYYYFYAKAGDVVNVDIDYGVTPNWGVGVDTTLGVFLSGIDANGISFPLLRESLYGSSGLYGAPDTGSSLDAYGENTDPFVDNFVVPTNGYYIVGVAAGYYASFQSGGSASGLSGDGGTGTYQINITGVTPNAEAAVAAEAAAAASTTTTTATTDTTATTTTTAPDSVQYVTIDIKPGSKGFGTLNPKANGVIPVAILSSSSFNALTVDTTAVTFGATGKETALIRCTARDVNHDGLLDLVCFADNRKSGFSTTSVEGAMQGTTKSGKTIQGRGPLKVIPTGNSRGGNKK